MTKNLILIIISGAIVVLLVAGYFFQQYKISQINSFDECAKAGYPIMESYPARCATPDGRTFTQEINQIVPTSSATPSLLPSPKPSPSLLISSPRPKFSPPIEDNVCITIITPAKNPATGECREFPTPCDVPEGWEKVDQC